MRLTLYVIGFLLAAVPAMAGGTVTYYLDGARISGEATTASGTVEVPLPSTYIPGSLRVSPAGRASVVRVEVEPLRPGAGSGITRLTERRKGLEDRLRAIEAREEIFKAAAKSQSSKAPRKTKGNPEPLTSVRKGTEYALTQLEEVYRARRQTEEGIRSVDDRLKALRASESPGGSVARLRLAGKGGVRYSYLVKGNGWTPFYDFRFNGTDSVEVALRAILPRGAGKGSVVPLSMADATNGAMPLPAPENFAVVDRRVFPVERAEALDSLQGGTTFSFRNSSAARLVPGEGACFRKGEYLGPVTFEGAAPGVLYEVVAGR
ncbi:MULTISPECIES: DUF4140 domain-containing protein [Geobacter]|uniref:DUF4140 domain-containing protein n=1 Tax=Geobacter TaxID=28231 RepID=UPI002573E3F1|nr:DUF4140 domain-containing protein [Geobacter sulfurreducens]BEH09749.1 DUF4140 domain-containing protein [Geobacter sulfurreducens subsp. ethanolicus]BET57644.1 DUF4140 domain-containing protein [Geobacter sp. 60473]